MESFRWDKQFETGLPDVDQQHHVLVDLINRLGEFLGNAQAMDFREITTVIDALGDYAAYHFREEERLMKHLGIDNQHLASHCRAHADFCREVARMRMEIASDDRSAAEYLLNFLVHWLAYHILGTDQSMARQIASIRSGTSPTEAYTSQSHIPDAAMEPILRALNELFHQVSERNRQLVELNRTLEAKVAERTHALQVANQFLEQRALTDALTGLPNRRYALSRLDREYAEAEHSGRPLAVMMIDADGFKAINDTCGHDAGDEVLRRLAYQLRDSVRNDDVVCRLGGDEFLIICPNTPLKGAVQVAEALRTAVAELRVAAGEGEWRGSVSIGVAECRSLAGDRDDLIKAADLRLYDAKRSGRNCVRW